MDVKEYRRAMATFATGVTIITTFDADRQPWGLTANSFASVSLEPPMISVCIAKSGRVFPALKASSKFGVNILSCEQQQLAKHFSSNVENRFTGVEWESAFDGAPLLPGASAHLDCAIHSRIDAGDHEILLGHVKSFAHSPVIPLVYCRGTFFAASQTEGLQ